MSVVTTGNIGSLPEKGLYAQKQKKKLPVKATPIIKVKTKNKGN